MNTLLELLEQDCTQSPAQLAAQAGMTEAEWNDAKALEAAILEQLVQANLEIVLT